MYIIKNQHNISLKQSMWMMCLMNARCAIPLNAKDGICNDMFCCFGEFAVTYMKQKLSMKNSIEKGQA